jgi:hypothetical protein
VVWERSVPECRKLPSRMLIIHNAATANIIFAETSLSSLGMAGPYLRQETEKCRIRLPTEDKAEKRRETRSVIYAVMQRHALHLVGRA